MAFSTPYTFGFAAVVCVTCSLAVSLAAQSLREMQEINEKRDLQGSILTALGMPDLKGEAIDEAYDTRVERTYVDGSGNVLSDVDDDEAMEWLGTDIALQLGEDGELSDGEWTSLRTGAILAVYSLVNNGVTESYALPVAGMGLWGPISGFIALEPDGTTVRGATFFAPKETPGLGYEIVAAGFTDQFPGKQVFNDAALAPIDVVKGDVDLKCAGRTDHCVRGISGATITSNGVDAMLEGWLAAYEPYLATIRSGGAG